MARRCWLVRTGDTSRQVALYESSGIVGMTPDADADQRVFGEQIRRGDIVVTVDEPARQLLVGEVAGDSEPATEGTPATYVRTVDWVGRYGRDDRTILSSSMEAQTRLPSTVRELTPTEAWLEFTAGVRERPPVAAARAVAGAPSRSSSATKAAPRARATKAASPPKIKPTAPVYRRCPGCQLQKAPSQFRSGSEHCVDCRERLGED